MDRSKQGYSYAGRVEVLVHPRGEGATGRSQPVSAKHKWGGTRLPKDARGAGYNESVSGRRERETENSLMRVREEDRLGLR